MNEKSIENKNKPDFEIVMKEYSDEELKKVLQKRTQYQPEAAESAIKEAIKRGLIHSEQDLYSEEFREAESGFDLFPVIEDSKLKERIRKSLARILLITGVVPTVFGVLKVNGSNLIEGILLILLGGIWIFTSARLMRRYKKNLVLLLSIMLIASAVYLLNMFWGNLNRPVMDFVIPIVLYALVVYGLLFMKRLGE